MNESFPLKRIVVLFDSASIRREVIRYAVALAQRMEAEITLLMLLPNDFVGEGGAGRQLAMGEEILAEEAQNIAEGGAEVRFEVMVGDPRSELLKFMATHRSFHAAVWGGDPMALRPGSFRRQDHWITAIRGEIECSLVAPARRWQKKRR